MADIVVSTIGFTRSSAQHFFERLQASGTRKVLDVRLHNTSQLSGFAKAVDLAYLLSAIGGIAYAHQPALAPTNTMLKDYRKAKGSWRCYEEQFLALMAERQVERRFTPDDLDGACLLCSESAPHQCHRRLVCEYLGSKWGSRLVVQHL